MPHTVERVRNNKLLACCAAHSTHHNSTSVITSVSLATNVFVFIVTSLEIRSIQAARNNPQSITISRNPEEAGVAVVETHEKAQDRTPLHAPHTPFSSPLPPLSRLTVRLLVPRARTGTTELLGLAPPVVGDEQCAVVLDEGLLELVLRVLVDVLLVVGDDGFGNGLADGVDLRGVSTAGDADADVDISCSDRQYASSS